MSPPEKDDSAKPSGRVRHDSGGRAVWEWAVDSGKHAIDSTSRLLKKLDISGLTLMGDGDGEADKPAKPAAEAKDAPVTGGKLEIEPTGKGGFNPYDTRMPPKRAPAPSKPRAPAKPRITQPVMRVKEKKRGFFARLFGGGRK